MNETDIEAMRWWIGDCAWGDMDEESIAALTEGQILRGIARWYDGGIAGFMADIQAVKRRSD